MMRDVVRNADYATLLIPALPRATFREQRAPYGAV